MDWAAAGVIAVLVVALVGAQTFWIARALDGLGGRLDGLSESLGQRITDQGVALGQRISDLDAHLSARLDRIADRVGALEHERSPDG